MDKYYTPVIEEFHIGFELEFYDEDDQDWNSSIIKNQSDLCNWTGMIIPLRVKYLDKEDIESLGFIFSEDKGNLIRYYKDNIALLHFTEGRIGIFTMDPSKDDMFSRINVDPVLINYIKIKNKSELKVLLNQLSIINEKAS